MTTAVNIVLADAQGTPVNHTFVPVGLDKEGTFWYEDRSAINSVGFWRISVKQKAPDYTQTTGTYRTEIGLHEPVLETLGTNAAGLTPPPTVAYVSRYILTSIDPVRSLLQNRKDMAKMFPLLLQKAEILTVLENHDRLQ